MAPATISRRAASPARCPSLRGSPRSLTQGYPLALRYGKLFFIEDNIDVVSLLCVLFLFYKSLYFGSVFLQVSISGYIAARMGDIQHFTIAIRTHFDTRNVAFIGS